MKRPGLYAARPLSSKDGPAPGVRLERCGEDLNSGGVPNQLSLDEARELGADLILAAGASEAQWPKDPEAGAA